MVEIETKVCTKCGEEKEFNEFRNDKKGIFGLRADCKDCNKKIQKKYYEKHKEKIKEYNKQYNLINKKKCTKCEVEKTLNRFPYYNKNKKTRKSCCKICIRKINKEYTKKKRQTDELYRITHNIRTLIGYSIRNKGYKKTSKTQQILGCSFEEFYAHLESKFEPWMNWHNYGKYNGEINYGWDIDHIIPNSSATTEDELIKLNHYTNLQPLCSKINRDIKKNN